LNKTFILKDNMNSQIVFIAHYMASF